MKLSKFSVFLLTVLCLFSASCVLEGRRQCSATFGINLGNLVAARPQPVCVQKRVVVAEPVTVLPARARTVVPVVSAVPVVPVNIAGPVLARAPYPYYEEVYVYPQAPVRRVGGLSLNWQFNFGR